MTPDPSVDGLSAKIARLVEERGWNQEDFARIAQLNRQTVRQILLGQGRKPHNATVQACARALGLSVIELRTLPLDRLLPRMHGPPPDGEEGLQRLYEFGTDPNLRAWLERNEDRARQLSPDEIDEVLRFQESSAAVSSVGVERFVELLERRRRLVERVKSVAGSEYLETLELLVGLLYDKVRPARRASQRQRDVVETSTSR
ncbi:MAG: helix-turn-helix transcriptional regulator [Gemmataceae bacterium]